MMVDLGVASLTFVLEESIWRLGSSKSGDYGVQGTFHCNA